MREKPGHAELARRAWSHLFGVGEQHMEGLGAAMQKLGLTPVMGHFLDELIKMSPGPMSQLVARMEVDAGWVTDIVDKLEARGDVARRPSKEDRRVKIIEVTPAGKRTWQQVQNLMYSPPPEVLQLPEEDLKALLKIGERISAAAKKPTP
jgi:DNA-binding MarR family transcriptional regulator